MTCPIYYSANPWFSYEVGKKYRNGNFFAWVSEYFDSERQATPGSAGTLIAPSSNPRKIYEDLCSEYKAQEENPRIIRDHRRKFKQLAKLWVANNEITQLECDEIIASVTTRSWRIWKPVLYVIPKSNINPSRVIEVPRPDRAGYGPEYKICDLKQGEFDILDLSEVRL